MRARCARPTSSCRAPTSCVLGAGGAARAASVRPGCAPAPPHLHAARRTRSRARAARRARVAHAARAKLHGRCEHGQRRLTRRLSTASARDPGHERHAGRDRRSAGLRRRCRCDALPRSAVVCDLVYKPLETAVLARARAAACARVDGLGMLLHQGALAFERWTGQAPPIDVMRKALGY